MRKGEQRIYDPSLDGNLKALDEPLLKPSERIGSDGKLNLKIENGAKAFQIFECGPETSGLRGG